MHQRWLWPAESRLWERKLNQLNSGYTRAEEPPGITPRVLRGHRKQKETRILPGGRMKAVIKALQNRPRNMAVPVVMEK